MRSLERAIGGVVRFKAVEWAEHLDAVASQEGGITSTSGAIRSSEYDRVVEEHQLERILGVARWDGEEKEREERRGIVYGLVVMGQGEGGILPVETIALPGTGRLRLTGSLGDVCAPSFSLPMCDRVDTFFPFQVIKESGELALSWVKNYAYDLCITNRRSDDPLKVPEPIDIHLHLPAGATKKDGPSAGVAMVCLFLCLSPFCLRPPAFFWALVCYTGF